MPLGLVRSGDFRNGTPIVLPHVVGTPATLPEPQENVQPQSNSSLSSNLVTWTPSPAHFGNTVDLSLQTVAPIVIVTPGGTGTVNINLTQLLGTPTPTLTYSGAPTGVTLAFAPNPNTGTSVCTVTVSSSVSTGKYTIAIIGTSGTEVDSTNLHLVVAAASSSSVITGSVLMTVTAAQLLTLNSHPLLVVPGVAGYVPIVESGFLIYNPGTEAYTIGGNDDILLLTGNVANPSEVLSNYTGFGANLMMNVIGSAQPVVNYWNPSYQFGTPTSPTIPGVPASNLVGYGITLIQYDSSDAFPTGTDWTGGNGTFTLFVEYTFVKG